MYRARASSDYSETEPEAKPTAFSYLGYGPDPGSSFPVVSKINDRQNQMVLQSGHSQSSPLRYGEDMGSDEKEGMSRLGFGNGELVQLGPLLSQGASDPRTPIIPTDVPRLYPVTARVREKLFLRLSQRCSNTAHNKSAGFQKHFVHNLTCQKND
ncbi:hypothetical protein P7K49_003120 [Saguinus oedipus]|uniref:Uncharacterized protein n=1 Tax=Saguinus oedipus TaxID=9490 RepID=A0ABQ9WL90_SAGOE|nr:hypothetical protein P7K49_003120 [Saguinus oedipus]